MIRRSFFSTLATLLGARIATESLKSDAISSAALGVPRIDIHPVIVVGLTASDGHGGSLACSPFTLYCDGKGHVYDGGIVPPDSMLVYDFDNASFRLVPAQRYCRDYVWPIVSNGGKRRGEVWRVY